MDWSDSSTAKSMANGTHSAVNEDANDKSYWSHDSTDGMAKVTETLNMLLADVFTLYFKTKNFHWHMSGPHFRDYHWLLDEQAEQLFASTDVIAERVRKMGGRTLRSVQHIVRLTRLSGNEADFVAPSQMLAELRSDNERLADFMRDTHFVCGGVDDVASMSVLENWIDEAERRVWFLLECGRNA
jgi:starvation-inducible DNA-binding protein